MKKLVIFSMGGKGGVGKSWLITLLIDWYESRKVPFKAIDMDNENNTLCRFYSASDYADIASEKNLDEIINGIVLADTPVTVIDMRAASSDRITPWLKNVDFDALTNECGIRFTAVGVVDTSKDSIANIGFWAKEVLGKNKEIRYVIGRNMVRGSELGYDDSPTRAEYKTLFDIAEIEIPKLEEWVHGLLENGSLRVNAALNLNDAASPLNEFMNRSRLKRYQQRIFEQFENIKDRLLPEAPSAPANRSGKTLLNEEKL